MKMLRQGAADGAVLTHVSRVAALDDFIRVEETHVVPPLVAALFERKFRLAAPLFPYHFVATVTLGDGESLPGCYTHATDCGDIALGGGACTDNRVLRRLDAGQRTRLRDAGGIYRYTLVHMLEHLCEYFPVLFACCGDALSERVMLATDFQPTGESQLLARWLHDVAEPRRAQMIAKAVAFMPF